MNSYNVLFFNHFHTERSNNYTQKHQEDIVEWEGKNHYGSPIEILENLGKGEKAVMTITEHFETNGKEFYDQLAERVEQEGGKYEINEKCLILKKEGSEIYLINGVEASYKDGQNEIVIAGLKLEDNSTYYQLTKKELREKLDKAAYAHPAHPYLGQYGMEKEILNEVCTEIQNSKSKLFIPQTKAYGPLINRLAKGKLTKDKTTELANKYETEKIIELDHHIHLPKNLNGMPLIREKSTEKIREEKIPVEEIKKAKKIKSKTTDKIIDTIRSKKSFAPQMLRIINSKKLWDKIGFPQNKKTKRQVRNKYYKKEIEQNKIQDLKQKTEKVN